MSAGLNEWIILICNFGHLNLERNSNRFELSFWNPCLLKYDFLKDLCQYSSYCRRHAGYLQYLNETVLPCDFLQAELSQ